MVEVSFVGALSGKGLLVKMEPKLNSGNDILLIDQIITNSPKRTFVRINFSVPDVLCENGPPPVSTFPWARMFTRHLCMYSLGQWSDQRYYVIKYVLSDLRGRPLPPEGNISPSSHADFGCCVDVSPCLPRFSTLKLHAIWLL